MKHSVSENHVPAACCCCKQFSISVGVVDNLTLAHMRSLYDRQLILLLLHVCYCCHVPVLILLLHLTVHAQTFASTMVSFPCSHSSALPPFAPDSSTDYWTARLTFRFCLHNTQFTLGVLLDLFPYMHSIFLSGNELKSVDN